MSHKNDDKNVIGRTTTVAFPAEGISDVPAKVDTGADGSAIWASNITIDDDGILSFRLFGKGSKFYTGYLHQTKDFDAIRIRSAHGTVQLRYRVKLTVVIAGRRVNGTFSLADRSKNTYPILLGCRLLNKKFLVDVSQGDTISRLKRNRLTVELHKNPKLFFEKYHLNNSQKEIT